MGPRKGKNICLHMMTRTCRTVSQSPRNHFIKRDDQPSTRHRSTFFITLCHFSAFLDPLSSVLGTRMVANTGKLEHTKVINTYTSHSCEKQSYFHIAASESQTQLVLWKFSLFFDAWKHGANEIRWPTFLPLQRPPVHSRWKEIAYEEKTQTHSRPVTWWCEALKTTSPIHAWRRGERLRGVER